MFSTFPSFLPKEKKMWQQFRKGNFEIQYNVDVKSKIPFCKFKLFLKMAVYFICVSLVMTQGQNILDATMD